MHRALLATACAAALVSAVGCTDATGSVQGGDPTTLQVESPDAGGAATWTVLYETYFGPSGSAPCSAMPGCHRLANEIGAEFSGFVCGDTKDACWQGLTMGLMSDAGQSQIAILAPDAGDPATTTFWSSLHKETGGGLGNMPCGNAAAACPATSASYTFTSADLALIRQWFQMGALDN
jgi:hypothetical protein